MAAARTPKVRTMALCDAVLESKTEAAVFHLKGVRQELTAYSFPFIPRRLWLFSILSSRIAGSYTGYVRVVNDRTRRVVFYSYLQPRPRFGEDGDVTSGRAAIRCVFPEPGRYAVQIWFFQAEGSDVLKGEIPLSVLHEEDLP